MLHQMFKSVIDQDRAAVVICDTEHTIVYMNPAAVQNYANRVERNWLERVCLPATTSDQMK